MWIPSKTRTARKSSFLPKTMFDYNFKSSRQSMKIKFNVRHSIYNLHKPGYSTMILPHTAKTLSLSNTECYQKVRARTGAFYLEILHIHTHHSSSTERTQVPVEGKWVYAHEEFTLTRGRKQKQQKWKQKNPGSIPLVLPGNEDTVVRQGNVKVNINQTRNPGKWIFQRHAASGQEEKKNK